MENHAGENSLEKMESSEESDSGDEDQSYIRTRRSVIQVCKSKTEKKPDRLNGEYSYQNTIKQRVIGQPCIDCRMECDLRVAERFRQDNYLTFWGKLKSWEDRRNHLRRLVQILRVPHPKNETRKKFLRKYYLEMDDGYTLVCKTMFFNTLAISAKFVETTLQKYPENVLDETKVKLINCPTNSAPKNLESSTPTRTYIKKEKEVEPMVKPKEVPVEGQLLVDANKEDIRPPCACSEQCGQKIPEEARLKIYEHFWTKLQSWEERKLFVINTIEKDRYTFIRMFVLPVKDAGHINVCQEMYLNTLALSEKAIDLLLPITEPLTPKPLKRQHSPEFYPTPHQFTQNHHTKDNRSSAKDLLPPPLKPPCNCPLHCRLKLTEDVRQQIHREYWNLPVQVDQKHFILSTIQVQKSFEIKQFMLPCLYDSIMVCKEMYLNTLSISEEFLLSTVRNINHDGSIREEPNEGSYVHSGNSSNGKTGESSEASSINSTASQIKEDVRHSTKTDVKRVKKQRRSKKMGPPCPTSCRLQCSTKFTEDNRKELHDQFWYSMDWQVRKKFVMDTVEEFPIKNRSIPGRLTKRNFSRIYRLPLKEEKVTVCQKMYFNTLSICSKFVSTVHIWASQVKW
ncbi:uncharacterized protein [Euwallacea similis]|uniref:uncharacterized protein n=1 Tax=Euwallacea similis TaxID=1736056 RepID=UPI00344C73B2